MGTLSTLRRLSKSKSEAESEVVSPESLKREGFVASSENGLTVLRSPSQEYTRSFSSKTRQRVYGEFSEREYIFDSAGNLVSERVFQPKPVYYSGVVTIFEPVIQQEKSYDFASGRVTTRDYSGQRVVEDTTIYNRTGFSRAEYETAREEYNRALKENVLSVSVDRERGLKTKLLASPTFYNVFQAVEGRIPTSYNLPSPGVRQTSASFSSPDVTDTSSVLVNPRLYNKFVLDSLGPFPTEKVTLPSGKVVDRLIPLAKDDDYAYLTTTRDADVSGFVAEDYLYRLKTRLEKGYTPFLPSVDESFWSKVGSGSLEIAGVVGRSGIKTASALVSDVTLNYENLLLPGREKSETLTPNTLKLILKKDEDLIRIGEAPKAIAKTFIVDPLKGTGILLYESNPGLALRNTLGLSWPNQPIKRKTPGQLLSIPEVQSAEIGAGILALGFYGGATGVFISESLAIGFGAWTLPGALAEGDVGETAVSVASIVAGRPFKKISRPFKELFFERLAESENPFASRDRSVTSKNIKDLIRQFETGRVTPYYRSPNLKSNIEFVTISPAPFKPYLTTRRNAFIRVSGGEKGQANLEPFGAYLGYYRAGNVMFSGIPGTATYRRLTLNPFKNLFIKPTATLVRAFGFAREPRSVANIPGFEVPGRLNFYESVKGLGLMFQTKRSEIGLGTVKRQTTVVAKDVKMTTKSLKAGDVVPEAGTSEAEVISKAGEVWRKTFKDFSFIQRFAGYKYYTVYGEKTIPFTKIRIPFSGEYVRVDTAFLMKNRPFVGRIRSRSKIYDPEKKQTGLVEERVTVKSARKRSGSTETTEFVSVKPSFSRAFSQSSLNGDRSFFSDVSRQFSSSTISPSKSFSTSRTSSLTSSISPSISTSLSRSISESVSRSFSPSSTTSTSRSTSSTSSRSTSTSTSSTTSRGTSFSRGFSFPPSWSSSPTTGEASFNVFVRESQPKGKGKPTTVKVNKKPLPYERALSLGAFYTDNSSARSFKITSVKKGKTISPIALPDLVKFRAPKGKSKLSQGFYVEKTPYLIDTPGEIQGITARGLLARQKKNHGGFAF